MRFLRSVASVRTDLLLMIGAAVVVGLVIATQILAADTFVRYRSLVGVISQIKQATTESHIWLEERLAGDLSVDIGVQVDGLLAHAFADCRVMLDGSSGITEVSRITDSGTRATVDALCQRIVDLRQVADGRLAGTGNSAGSALDQKYDQIFREVILLTDESQSAVNRTIDASSREIAIVYNGIAVVVATIFGAVILLVRRYRRTAQASNLAHGNAETKARDVLAEAQREAQQADVLNILADRVSFASDESDLVEAAISGFRRLLPSVAGDVLLVNNSLNRLMVAATWGLADDEVGRPAKIDSPSLCPGIRRGSVYAIGDGADDLRVSCAVHRIDAGSSLCVPMLALGKSIGVIHLTRSENHAFDSSSQQLAARVAEQIGLGLANFRLMQTMERLAMADPLTGLSNARFFDPMFEREIAIAKREGSDVSVVMIDIDHFKKLNDTYGHPAGDEALKGFARTVTGAVRESDTIARYGGEEFVVLLRDTDLAGATIAAEKIRAAVERTVFEIGPNRTARMTASFGTASTSAHGNDRMLLMRTADAALYRAKESGRNRVVAADSAFGSPPAPESSGGAPAPQILVKRTSHKIVPRIA